MPPFLVPLISLGFRDYRPVEVNGEIRDADENRRSLPTAPVTFHLFFVFLPGWKLILNEAMKSSLPGSPSSDSSTVPSRNGPIAGHPDITALPEAQRVPLGSVTPVPLHPPPSEITAPAAHISGFLCSHPQYPHLVLSYPSPPPPPRHLFCLHIHFVGTVCSIPTVPTSPRTHTPSSAPASPLLPSPCTPSPAAPIPGNSCIPLPCAPIPCTPSLLILFLVPHLLTP